MNHVRAAALLFMLGAALLATVSACGGGDDGDADQEPTKPSATAASSPAATADDGSSDDGDDGASTITLVAKNTLWDKTKLEAKVGEITFEVDNQDGGIVHNIHVYKGQDADGEDVGTTELEAGPIVQTLKLDLEPGEYFFVCDAHPATMAGTIEVD